MTSALFEVQDVRYPSARRRLVDQRPCFAAYAGCQLEAHVEREEYLSHFAFELGFAEYLDREQTENGYNGLYGAAWRFWDKDRADDLTLALLDARRLSGAIFNRRPEPDDHDRQAILPFRASAQRPERYLKRSFSMPWLTRCSLKPIWIWKLTPSEVMRWIDRALDCDRRRQHERGEHD
jgi:hypothetical protein